MLFYIIFASILFLNYLISKFILISLVSLLSNALLTFFWIYISWNVSQSLWRFKSVPKERIDPKGKAVLITGCDTGFGNRLAKRLAAEGYHVLAGCLFPEGDGAKELKQELRQSVSIIALDVTSDESVANARKVVQTLVKNKGLLSVTMTYDCETDPTELWCLVNNAGILSSLEIEFGDMSSFVSQMNVNCMGIVRVTKAFLPLLRESKGRVVNMASLAGRFAIPGMVGYCMSKSAVISFSDGLRREMKKWDIDVICIEPHLFRTNLVNSDSQHSALLRAWEQTPEDVRQAYGECYLEGYKALLNKAIQTARPAVDSVVDTMFGAVTHKSVSAYYRVLGPFERLRVWMFEFVCPTRVMDWLSYIGSIWVTGLPERLRCNFNKTK